MNSTIKVPGEENSDSGEGNDEVWIRINSNSEQAESRLRLFFSTFTQCPKYPDVINEITIEGKNNDENKKLKQIVTNHLKLPVNIVSTKEKRTIISLNIKQGGLNSRKADITPFLPK